MPVQINELIVKAVVDQTAASNVRQSAPAVNKPADDDAVEKVLEIIKEKLQR